MAILKLESRHIDKTLALSCGISIQVSLNGISYIIYNLKDGTIYSIRNINLDKSISESYIDDIQELFRNDTTFKLPFRQVTVCVLSLESTVIPNAVFDEKMKRYYLYHLGWEATMNKDIDVLSYDISPVDGVVVFLIEKQLLYFLNEFLPTAKIVNQQSNVIKDALINSVIRKKFAISLSVDSNEATIVFARNKKLIYAHNFKVTDKNEFVDIIERLITLYRVPQDTYFSQFGTSLEAEFITTLFREKFYEIGTPDFYLEEDSKFGITSNFLFKYYNVLLSLV